MKGFTGKILHIDLTKSLFEIEKPSDKFYRKYIGGACLGAYYLVKNLPIGIDPYAPENILVFATSPIVGAPISGNARHCITTKSPLTGGIISSEGGGYWGPELRFAGYDALVITGRSEKPVYLWIHDGQFEIRDAAKIWGRTTGDAQDIIRAELGDPKVRVAQIGPAGEDLVRFAGVVNELKHFNGRGGIGAVMGSKNLRAVVVRGTSKPDFFDMKKIEDMAREGAARVRGEGGWKEFKKLGTTQNVTWNTSIGGLPTRNWTMGTFSGKDQITAEKFADEMMDKPGTCWACAQSCKRDIKAGITHPWLIEKKYGGPEYETIGMLGSNCMVDDLYAISKANEIASKYCMDTISLGGVIGFVMECFENGLIKREDIGFDVPFGSSESIVRLAEMVGKREGFGFEMGEGIARLSKKIGPASERYAVHVKGKEFPAHAPTAKGLMALIYAVGSLGPDHVSSDHDGGIQAEPDEIHKGLGLYDSVPNVWEMTYEKAKVLAFSERLVSAIDSFSVCQFCFHTWTIYTIEDLIELIQASTGWRYTMQELILLGERRVNLMRIFNEREGFDITDDTLPARLFEEPLLDQGPRGGAVVDRNRFMQCREEYYRLNGWNPESGKPTDSKLRELGLEWALR